jgi:hypothetical protein
MPILLVKMCRLEDAEAEETAAATAAAAAGADNRYIADATTATAAMAITSGGRSLTGHHGGGEHCCARDNELFHLDPHNELQHAASGCLNNRKAGQMTAKLNTDGKISTSFLEYSFIVACFRKYRSQGLFIT